MRLRKATPTTDISTRTLLAIRMDWLRLRDMYLATPNTDYRNILLRRMDMLCDESNARRALDIPRDGDRFDAAEIPVAHG